MTRCCRRRLRRRLCGGIEHSGNEGSHVLGPSAGGEVPVPDELLIEPRGTRVHQIVADPGPGGEGSSVHKSRRCEYPRSMTEGGDGLATCGERANELPCRGGLPEQVGIDKPAGQQQTVVVAGIGFTDRLVHADPAGGHVQVHPADPSVPQGHDIDLGAGFLQGSQRNDQLDLLETVGRQGGDRAALEPASGGHVVPLSLDGAELAELPLAAEASIRAPQSWSYLASCSAVSEVPAPGSRTRPWAN